MVEPESFFAGVPGLTGATSGLSQVTGLFGAAGLSASSGLAHADSLASSASLPALAGIGGGSGFGACRAWLRSMPPQLGRRYGPELMARSAPLPSRSAGSRSWSPRRVPKVWADP